jgi:AmiR/NasT family two-component response regulator
MDDFSQSEAEAFKFLQKTAMDSRRTLKLVSQEVINGVLKPD